MGFCCCENCGWSEAIGLLIMCNNKLEHGGTMLDIDKLQRTVKVCAKFPKRDCKGCEYSDGFICLHDELMADIDKCMEILKGIVHCRECKYAKHISADYMGCSCLIDGIDSDYVMTVKPDSFCSWGERNAE